MANKMTKKDYFNKVLTFVAGDAELEKFIQHEIELLDKKSANKKPTKTQAENEGYKAEILSVLTTEGATVNEIRSRSEVLGGLSNQRVSALLRQMIDAKEVVKTVDKKKSLFSLPL
jgi:hypothetical protein